MEFDDLVAPSGIDDSVDSLLRIGRLRPLVRFGQLGGEHGVALLPGPVGCIRLAAAGRTACGCAPRGSAHRRETKTAILPGWQKNARAAARLSPTVQGSRVGGANQVPPK